jgi:hypothetical protein
LEYWWPLLLLLHNLALAVLISDHFSFGFAWESAKRIRARKYIDEKGKALKYTGHYFLVLLRLCRKI